MKKIIFFLVIFMSSISLYSQDFNPALDYETTLIDEFGEQDLKVAKHLVYGFMDTTKYEDTNHIIKIIDHLEQRNSKFFRMYLRNSDNRPLVEFFERRGIDVYFRSVTVIPFIIRISDQQDVMDYFHEGYDGSLIINMTYYAIVEESGVPPMVSESTNPAEPNDPRWSEQWYFKQSHSGNLNLDIDADKLWWINKGGYGVRIYIIDSGIRLTAPTSSGTIDHEDFNTSFINKGTNWIPKTPNNIVNDQTGHGSGITGLVAATMSNSKGIAGMVPNCEIIIDKVKGAENEPGNTIDLAAALEKAVNFKRDNPSRKVVIISSMNYNTYDEPIFVQLGRAETFNVPVVFSAGNVNGSSTYVQYPAKHADTYTTLYSVGSSKNDDQRAPYSRTASVNEELTLMAPSGASLTGTGSSSTFILTTGMASSTEYPLRTGTSFSAPMVGATIAAMLICNPDITANGIFNAIVSGCESVPNGGYSLSYGHGRLNAFNSVVAACNPNLPSLPTGGTIDFDKNYRIASNLTMPVRCTINVKQGKVLILDKNKTLTFPHLTYCWIKLEPGATFIQRTGSTVSNTAEIITPTGATYCVETGATLNLTGPGPGGPNDRGCVYVDGGDMVLDDNTNITLDGGGFVQIDDGGSLVMGDNSNITFDNESFLLVHGGSKIILGENSSLTFKGNSAFRTEDPNEGPIEIYSSNGAKLCEGLKFINNFNPNSSVKNCIFTNCKNPISITNDNSSAFIPKVIQGNTFNLPEGGTNCIYAEKAFSIKIDGNTFNMPTSNTSQTFGVFIKNSPISELEAAGPGELDTQDPSLRYQGTIINNNFNGGTVAMGLWNFSSMLRCYVYNNTFTNVGQVGYGILSRQITGDIKNNTFASTNYNTPMHYHQSTVNLFANDLKSNNIDLFLNTGSSVRMAPIPMNGNFLWFGGQNKISSVSGDNINLNSYCDLFLDYGANCFSKPNNNQKYNVFGYTNNSDLSYLCRGNSWSPGSAPNIKLWNNAGFPISGISYAPTTVCNENIESDAFEVSEAPFDVIDTLYTSVDNSGNTYAADEMLLAEGINFYYDQLYTDAINSSKNYIDAYPEKKECTDCLTQLFGCYIGLDTSVIDNQYRDGLYSNLKIYLTDKINSGLYSVDFNDLAYSFILICDSYIGNYTDAMDGYLFIAAFHPDPETRLLAGWDAVEIAALMGEGEGNGKNNSSDWESIENRIFENAKQDPLKLKMKVDYEKTTRNKYKKELTSRGEKTSESTLNVAMSQVESVIFTDKQKQIADRTKNILGTYRSLSKEQRLKEQTNDMLNLLGNDLTRETDKISNEIVSSFSLSQNYPNPFNPTTNIKFALPKAGFVSLKVFDVTGRMIKELVSEFKETGNYSVVFDGAGISSGVYFYKLETSNFVDTKRMVLIK